MPYRRPARFASGAVERADNVLVRIHTDAGLVGHAEAQPRPYTYGETQASIVAAIRGWFAPRLLGMRPGAIEEARAASAGLAGNHCARGAVDVALWDLLGQLAGVPCSTLLGGYADRVRGRAHGELRHAGGHGRRRRSPSTPSTACGRSR